ncbi:universal stress protein [Gemmatimonadota bacterium]
MKALETILVGTVFSPRSDAAVKTAVTLAKTFESKIVLLHAVNEQAYALIAEHPGIPELERRLRERHLRADVEGVRDAEVVVRRGSAAEVICNTAGLENADLIVLGAGGPPGASEPRLSTTTARVIQRASTPILAVVTHTPEVPRHILCPVDTSDASRRALRNAHLLSQKFQAKLTVLHVLEPLSSLYAGIDMPDDSVELGFISPQKQRFDRFIAGLDFRDASWNIQTRRGRPHEQILAEVKKSGVDLLVMGTVGNAGVARFLLGSVTHKVTRQLPCSILTVKARDVLKQRIEADLKSVEECLRRGKGLLEDGFAADAIQEFDRCLAVSPTLVSAWDGKAQAYEQLGDGAGAALSRENAKRIRAFQE